MSRGRPVSAVGRVILEFINSGVRSNKEVAKKVMQHFQGELFDEKKLIQRVGNQRYLLKRAQVIETHSGETPNTEVV